MEVLPVFNSTSLLHQTKLLAPLQETLKLNPMEMFLMLREIKLLKVALKVLRYISLLYNSRHSKAIKEISGSITMEQLQMLKVNSLLLEVQLVFKTILLNSNSQQLRQAIQTTIFTRMVQSTLRQEFSLPLKASKVSRPGSKLNSSTLPQSRERTTESTPMAQSLMKLARYCLKMVELLTFKVLPQVPSLDYSAQTTYSWQNRTTSKVENQTLA